MRETLQIKNKRETLCIHGCCSLEKAMVCADPSRQVGIEAQGTRLTVAFKGITVVPPENREIDIQKGALIKAFVENNRWFKNHGHSSCPRERIKYLS